MRKFDKVNPMMHADKPWLLKYLYSAADPNTQEGAQWHKKFARNLFVGVGAIVAMSLLIAL